MFKHLIPVAMTLLSAGCATVGETSPTIFESARTGDGKYERALSSLEVLDLTRDWVPYAEMADTVYRREFYRDAKRRIAEGCDYVSAPTGSVLSLGLPRDWVRLDRAMIDKFGLERGEPAGSPLRPCRSGKGLNYETYVLLDAAGRPAQAAIAFRGTENTRYQWTSDWVANFSNVDFGVGGNRQFTEAKEEGARLINALARVLPKVASSSVCAQASGKLDGVQAPIDLVGHSLGGGLAQHLAYASLACDVRKTIAFDSSPATGWFYLHHRELVRTADPDISRVYIDGEALSFVRKVSTTFNSPRESRRDYRVIFPGVTGHAFALHSMALLSTHIKLAASMPIENDPSLLPDYASSAPVPGPLISAP
ncbi:hypothetical protein HF313_16815 [Massilia atriviolacea]|uniref:Uncharacterized protein n=1 Tax=Massilia atriviolacea TaxID=2495579 RepID=A0A430HTX6_9BURK|nr:hypothetical protein [Massilia atriviolacea]RSZ61038.1 hypothetical protein EJB06_02610 [Massilia atriviolacea]